MQVDYPFHDARPEPIEVRVKVVDVTLASILHGGFKCSRVSGLTLDASSTLRFTFPFSGCSSLLWPALQTVKYLQALSSTVLICPAPFNASLVTHPTESTIRNAW